MKGYFAFILFFLSLQAAAQHILTIEPGANFYISANTLVAFDSLLLEPSAGFNITGANTLQKSDITAHPMTHASIQRAYRFLNTIPSYSGTVIIYYPDAALNGLTEGSLSLNIHNGVSWIAYSPVSRDTVNNMITTNGLLSVPVNELTLGSHLASLPVQFGGVHLSCINGKLFLQWKTLQEENSLRFYILKSNDGLNWMMAGSVSAAGNSASEKNYSFTAEGTPARFYRISEVDADGRQRAGTILRNPCSLNRSFEIYPNPVLDMMNVAMKAERTGIAQVIVYDEAGRTVQKWEKEVKEGTNYWQLSLERLPKGNYTVAVFHDQLWRTVKVVRK